MKKNIMLQCRPGTHRNVHWEEGILGDLFKNGLELDVTNPRDNLVMELDRRFVQMWDKVQYEKVFISEQELGTKDMLALKRFIGVLKVFLPEKTLEEQLTQILKTELYVGDYEYTREYQALEDKVPDLEHGILCGDDVLGNLFKALNNKEG